MFTEILDKINFTNLTYTVMLIIILSLFLIIISYTLLNRLNSKPFVYLRKKRRLFTILLLLLFILPAPFLIMVYISNAPKIVKSSPNTGENWESYNKPIEIDLNLPVMIDNMKPTITPNLAGKWVWEPFLGIDKLSLKGKFYPEETAFPDQRIVVYIVNVKRLGMNNDSHEMALNFSSPKEPELNKILPTNKEVNINTDSQIEVVLNKQNYYLSTWKFSFDPVIQIDNTTSYSDVIDLKPKKYLKQDTLYTLAIERVPIRYSLKDNKIIEYGEKDFDFDTTFTTGKDALIQNFQPEADNAKVTQNISAEFSIEPDKSIIEQGFSINPQVNGVISWEDNKKFIFKPNNPLAYGTIFTAEFQGNDVKASDGKIYSIKSSFQFQTVGVVKVGDIIPANNAQKVVEDSKIEIVFDQDVDKLSAQNHFNISPNINGNFSWEGNNKMVFTPIGNFNYTTTYTTEISAGIKSLDGLDSKDQFTYTFTTRANEIILSDIPLIYQPYGSFSCNIYAAKMALNWKGFNIDATSLIKEIGNDSSMSNGQWTGDPYKEYVGNSDGSWGYGVYWDPIQKLFKNRGISTQLKQNWNINELAQSVASGNPVIIWRYNGESSDYNKNWTSNDGVSIYGINGQHGGVVIGIRGLVNHPDEFLLDDPWYGRIWLNAKDLDYYWSRMNRVGLIIN